MISQDYIAQLLQRSDITDVVQTYVKLRHTGKMHTGLCPFHNEKTPSFVVYPDTQSFYCFGCGAGGSVITFIQRISNVDYVQAINTLAQRCGMPLPDEDDEAGKKRTRLLSLNKQAARFYFNCMNEDTLNAKNLRAYWRKRGLEDSTIRKFGLGYAPDERNALQNHMYNLGFSKQELIDAGFVRKNDKNEVYEFFRHRAMIPIFDIRGNVIAFSGRKIDENRGGGKYINSPETVLYKKSKTLFALNIAKKFANTKFILCEGNMDAIALHQAGFTTAVAGCGTSVTWEHVKLLSDYTGEVVICFDSDEAGQKATQKAISLLSKSTLKVSVLKLTGAKDPDEFIAKFGAHKFEMLLNGSDNAVEYALANIRDKYDISSDDGRVAYLKEAVNILSASHLTSIERDVYAGRLAEQTSVAKHALISQITSSAKYKMRRDMAEREKRLLDEGMSSRINLSQNSYDSKTLGVVFAEQQLVGAVLRRPDLLKLCKNELLSEHFISEDMRRTYESMLRYDGEYFDIAMLSEELPEETITLLSRILAQNYNVIIGEQDIELYIKRILDNYLQGGEAAEKTVDELAQYMNTLKEKKV